MSKVSKPARKAAARRAKTPAQKMRDYRARMRAKGLKLKQMWVYDVDAPGFKEECARQWKVVQQNPDEQRILDWIEAATDWDDLPSYDWGLAGPPSAKRSDTK